LQGKVVLLAFWASWCDACMRKMPLLERMQADLGRRGLRILAINIEGNAAAVQRFKARRRSPLTMPVDDGRIAARYGVQVLPHLALIDRQGRIAHVQVGARGDETLRARVTEALGD
jgi:thiol-disulfide isomerase/thioredoxin